VAVPLALANVDTDPIIPARFLGRTRAEQVEGMFHGLRVDASGARRADFALNRPEYAGARILVADRNFGCGSLRGNAVTAMVDNGFFAFIAPSFGDIFFNNCLRNGVLPIRLPVARVDALRELLRASPVASLTVDLGSRTVLGPDGRANAVDVDAFRRDCLPRGADEIAMTLGHEADIARFEAARERGWDGAWRIGASERSPAAGEDPPDLPRSAPRDAGGAIGSGDMSALPTLRFDNSFARELEGFSVPWRPAVAPRPRLLFVNAALASELGLAAESLAGEAGAAMFSGNTLPAGAEPVAQVYAGHQFGGFSPQLGDGRALLLGEVVDRDGRRRDIAFKGSGRTPFSRGGDGKAAVGPMLREVLIGEAMHAMGIPTTRALAVAATGEPVLRDTGVLPGAVLTRVAASHIRVGSFQFFAARRDLERVRALAEYTIARHDPALAGTPERYAALLRAVAGRQARLIAQWMNVGFIHGVMNTDNMTLSGETIDYGPCAFVEAYDPAAVFSSIDHGGRYAYGNQPNIARWNLARLAETLLPLLSDDEDRALAQATEIIDAFPAQFHAFLLQGQRAKLGLRRGDAGDAEADAALAHDFLSLLHADKVDFTAAWRRLADAAGGDDAPLQALFADAQAPRAWLGRWRARCAAEDGGAPDASGRAARMRAVSPRVIPRNHRVEEALAAASDEDRLEPFERLLDALRRPFDDADDLAPYAEPAPLAVNACYRTFCGT
jgi:3-isopropylmalate dehydratase small subunit